MDEVIIWLSLFLFEQAQQNHADQRAHHKGDHIAQDIGHDGEDEDAAMRCGEGAAKGHGQGAGYAGAHNAGGQDTERIAGGEGNLS